MTSMRRHIAHLLAKACIAIDPDEPMHITTTRHVDIDGKETLDAIITAVNGSIGGNVGLGFRGDDGTSGTPARY